MVWQFLKNVSTHPTIGICTREKEKNITTWDLCMNIHSNFLLATTCKQPKRPSTEEQKWTVVCSRSGIQPGNEKDETSDPHADMGGSQANYTGRKNPVAIHVLEGPIHLAFQKMQRNVERQRVHHCLSGHNWGAGGAPGEKGGLWRCRGNFWGRWIRLECGEALFYINYTQIELLKMTFLGGRLFSSAPSPLPSPVMTDAAKPTRAKASDSLQYARDKADTLFKRKMLILSV